jgi:flagellar basal body-associated protein FliL
MSDAEKKQTFAEKPKKASAFVGIVLPALFAAGAAFGGAKLAAGHKAAPQVVEVMVPRPPGPTLALDAFLVNLNDSAKKVHAMKITLAVEFDEHEKEEAYKPLTPRIRDAVLTYLRGLTYEEAGDAARMEKTRSDLLERIKAAGAAKAQRVLVTDLVIQ